MATNNIGGFTAHSALGINNKTQFKELQDEAKLAFEQELESVKFVVIDEASMLGLKLFYQCDLRLKQAKGRSDVPFGGVCIYLVGDWSQLPPVCDKSLYTIGYNFETL